MIAWLGWHPLGLPSDDALFFSRGIEHFDVLDFSPHFPGYPGMVLLGRLVRLITGDAVSALFWLSIFSAGLCPLAVYAVARNHGATERASLWAGWVALTCPLLPEVGLSLLSDAPGLLFLLLGLVCLPHRWGWAGLLLGCGLAIRPSNGLYVLPLLLVQPRVIWGLLGIGLPCLAVILTLEGWAYIDEGFRFLHGHSTLWGNTALQENSPHWVSRLWHQPAGLAMGGMCLCVLWQTRRHSLAWMGGLGLVWVLLMQNPHNLRHLAPVLMLAAVLTALCPSRWLGMGLVLCQLYSHAWATDFVPRPNALQRCIAQLSALPPGIILSQSNITLLRQSLPQHRVVDRYYAGETAQAQQQTVLPVYWLPQRGCMKDLNTQKL